MMLPKDISALLALELNYPDIISLCLSNKKFNREICENETFWRNKLKSDFPQVEFVEIINKKREENKNSKQIYRELYNDFPNFFLHVSGSKIGESYLNLLHFLPKRKYEEIKDGEDFLRGFNSPAFIKPEYVNFFREGNFGRLDDKYGGATINEILEPLLKYNILTGNILASLMVIYVSRNSLRITDNGKAYYKVDSLMDKYFNNILTKLETEKITNRQLARKGRFNRNKFLYSHLINIFHEIIVRREELTKKQKLNNNPRLSRNIELIKGVLSDIRESLVFAPANED